MPYIYVPDRQPQQPKLLDKKILAALIAIAAIGIMIIYLFITQQLSNIGIIPTTTTVPGIIEENVTATTIPASASNFLKFVLSDYFFWFWVLVVVAIVFVPFGLWGFKAFFSWIDRNWIKPNKGYILIRQKLANDRFREYFALPTGKFIKVKNIENKEIQIPINLSKGWVAFDGNMPLIELDEQGQQMKMDRAATMQISQEETTKGWKAAYETGKLIGSFEILEEIKKLLMIGIIILLIVTIVGVYFSYNAYSKSTGLTADAVARAVISHWNNQTAIPTAGGGG